MDELACPIEKKVGAGFIPARLDFSGFYRFYRTVGYATASSARRSDMSTSSLSRA
jgi:hypothetical protein